MSDLAQTRPAARERLAPFLRETRALLAIGLPMGLTQLVQFSIHTVDVVMIGRLGAEELAASALGLVTFYMMMLLGFGPAMAASPLVSQALGADRENYESVRISVRMCLAAIVAFFPAQLLFFLLTEEFALLLGQPPELARLAEPYVLALAAGLPFFLGVMVLRNFLAAIERTRVPLAFIVATTFLNAFLNWLLIYGHWGFPRLELVGAGIASSISHATGFFLLLTYSRLDERARPFELLRDALKPHWDRLREVVRLGWPIGVTIAFEGLLFNAAVFLMGRIGVEEVAAYQVALNVAAIAFMMPLGLAMAGGVRIGLAQGAGDREGVRRAALVTIAAASAVMVAFWLPVMAGRSFVAGLYLDTDNPANGHVIALVALFLPIAAAFGLFDAVQVAANNCLRGLKDVRLPMILTGVSYWLVGFPLAAVLGLMTPLAAVGVWWGLLGGLAAAATFLSARLYLLTCLRGGSDKLAPLSQ